MEKSEDTHMGVFTLCPVYLSLDDNAMARQQAYRGLMSELPDLDVIAKIRHCANTGLVLGTEKFKKQVADMIE